MSAIRIAKTVLFVALAASRNPAVREAVRNAPKMIPAEQRRAALDGAKRAARKAGEITARVVPPNRFF
ncbi:hypothetical protein [Pelagibacterium lentulum]|uniref:Uncharacterized protein n=1 Tax=Pelagibacterium lentulum TaxID=2029865 RepID=A0A916RA99_9HYPH|nr:hypothetical protein [Pelagibacterium lentulum]GGA45039.1 hypothetical protein GCM10011499_13420 [Pelagibacterium lentulum]